MHVVKTDILKFLKGGDLVFIIPPFQRNYEWGKTQCEELFDDIKSISDDRKKRHYLGNVVYYGKKRSRTNGYEYILVDGQQRITTILILLCALRDCDVNKEIQSDIFVDYLENKIQKNEFKTKLKQTEYDQDDFSALVLQSDSINEENNVYKNFEYFKERIKETVKESNISMVDLFDSLDRLNLVEIDLEIEDDLEAVQKIFEKINSTGKPLTTGDLIRNF